jgi:hypothetical protein
MKHNCRFAEAKSKHNSLTMVTASAAAHAAQSITYLQGIMSMLLWESGLVLLGVMALFYLRSRQSI